MGIKERRERERIERRNLILNAAEEIVSREGLDGLSIRKIADRIEYSPALIYHYFRNKDAIVEALMERGYQKIINALRSGVMSTGKPENRFRQFAKNYIHAALNNPVEYKTVLLNSSPRVLKHTSVLFKGASTERPAVGMIHHFLKESYLKGCNDDGFVERTVQVLWAAMFGLIIRLLIEEDLPKEQKQNLIEHHIDMMIGSVKWMAQNSLKEELEL